MSNQSGYNYETIDDPYSSNLFKDEGEVIASTSNSTNNSAEGEVSSPSQISPNVINGSTLSNFWIESWIKSKNYKPKVQGFLIDGKRGYIECMDMYVAGTTKMLGDVTIGDYNAGQGIFYDASEGIISYKNVGWSAVTDDDSNKPEDNAMDLTNHEASELQAARNYEAVVDVNGSGDYTDIQAAIDAGELNIFVRKGVYTLTSDISLVSGLTIIGEDKNDVKINLNSDYKIKTTNTSVDFKTMTVANNSDIFTCSTSNININNLIVVSGVSYLVKSITDSTHLVVDRNYNGSSGVIVGCYYGDFWNNIKISNFTLYGGNLSFSSGCIELNDTINSELDNLIVRDNTGGNGILLVEYAFNNRLSNLDLINNNENGIWVSQSGYNTINNVNCFNNHENGILNSGENNIFSNITSNNNDKKGIDIEAGSYNCLSNIETLNNNDTGIYLSGNFNIVNSILAENNNGYGILLGGSNNSIANSNFSRNKNTGVHLSNADYNEFNNCNVVNNSTNEGISISTSNYNTFSNMNVSENSNGHGILIYKSVYNKILSSTISENGENGIICYGERNIITSNIIKDNSQKSAGAYCETLLTKDGTGTYIAKYCIISNNSIDCTKSIKSNYGINEGSISCDYNLIHGNIVQNAVTSNIRTQGANTVSADNIS